MDELSNLSAEATLPLLDNTRSYGTHRSLHIYVYVHTYMCTYNGVCVCVCVHPYIRKYIHHSPLLTTPAPTAPTGLCLSLTHTPHVHVHTLLVREILHVASSRRLPSSCIICIDHGLFSSLTHLYYHPHPTPHPVHSPGLSGIAGASTSTPVQFFFLKSTTPYCACSTQKLHHGADFSECQCLAVKYALLQDALGGGTYLVSLPPRDRCGPAPSPSPSPSPSLSLHPTLTSFPSTVLSHSW